MKRLISVIPERKKLSISFLPNIHNHRQFFCFLFDELRLSSWEDWYSVSRDTILSNGGQQILNFHGGTRNAIITSFPEYHWQFHKFSPLPKGNARYSYNSFIRTGYWLYFENRMQYLHYIANKLHVRTPEDWYYADEHDLIRQEGTVMKDFLSNYSNSLVIMILELNPSFKFDLWKFKNSSVPRSLWNKENIRECLDRYALENQFASMDSWYQVKSSDLVEFAGESFINVQSHVNGMLIIVIF